MKYIFNKIEKKWQNFWRISKIFEAKNLYIKKKYYVLDMFPYPSGSGLHVGHILGYIISDIFARLKRSEGYNVLHPIGFDSFGLPTEQFAIETGQHPVITTKVNINIYKKQLRKLGFSFDWTREIRTDDPSYYKWTQFIFLQFFNSWYDKTLKKSRYIAELTKIFEKEGNWKINATSFKKIKKFSKEEWKKFSFLKKENILQNFRIAYLAISTVNWCKDLGTVLANDEIKNGRSLRGGYCVYKKKMMQWNMRIIFYAEILLFGLNKIDWPYTIKNVQYNWIEKSYISYFFFPIVNYYFFLKVYSKYPYIIFKIGFIIINHDNHIIKYFIKNRYKKELKEYIQNIKNINKNIKGNKYNYCIFLGIYAKNPFTKNEIPIYLNDYISVNHGMKVIMTELLIEKYYHIPSVTITNIRNNSSIKKIIEKGVGYGDVNYRLHDLVFSRQRYWGEPIPIYYIYNIVPCAINENKLPLLLPDIYKYISQKNGAPPLKMSKKWVWDEIKREVRCNILINKKNIFSIETMTMPSWAGSSWYMLNYMNPRIEESFIDNENYWNNVDLYIGGAEHSSGHLIYARFWYKFMSDHNWLICNEPFIKLINQGMILGNSALIAKIIATNKFISIGLENKIANIPIDISLIRDYNLINLKELKRWRKYFYKSDFITEKGSFYCKRVLEKMSKSKYNIINPDNICSLYGADTLRVYEMFFGPIKRNKSWNDKGINGIYNFINKFWKLFYKIGYFFIEDLYTSFIDYTIIYSLFKKIKEDMINLSFNTSISFYMILTNELILTKCRKISILEKIIIIIAPFAPHIVEELWHYFGYKSSIIYYNNPPFYLKSSLEKIMEIIIIYNRRLYLKINYPYKREEKSILEIIFNNSKILQLSNLKLDFKIILMPYFISTLFTINSY